MFTVYVGMGPITGFFEFSHVFTLKDGLKVVTLFFVAFCHSCILCVTGPNPKSEMIHDFDQFVRRFLLGLPQGHNYSEAMPAFRVVDEMFVS